MDEQKVYEIVEIARSTGSVRKGTNEATKALERKKTVLVVYASDVTPPEIVMHLPLLAKEKDVPLAKVSSKDRLGVAAGLNRGCAAIAILDAGEAKKQLEKLLSESKQ